MRNLMLIASLVVFASPNAAAAQGKNAGDRALGAELNRDKAETRIERLRQDQRQKNERPAARAQKIQPSGGSAQQPSR